MLKKLTSKKSKKEQLQKNNEYIKELGIIILEHAKISVNELSGNKELNDRLLKEFNGIEGLKVIDEFLAKKITTALVDYENYMSGIKKYLCKDSLRPKDMVDVEKRIIEIRALTTIIKEYNSRLREEKILKQS